MKTTKYNFSPHKNWRASLFLFSLVFTTAFAQVEEKPEAKVDAKTEINKPNSIEAVGDKIEFKNETTNSILTITDEGSNAASILIPQGPTLTDPSDNDKLYNVGGTLHWNGSALGTSGSAGGWTDAGTIIYNTTLSDKVGIGTTNPLGKLSVFGQGSNGAAVYGATTQTGADFYYGGYFNALGDIGIGVYGKADGVTGRGVSGFSAGNGGIGVYGHALGLNAFGGFFIGRGYFSQNVGIGIQSPLVELHILDINDADGNAAIRLQSQSSGGNTLIEFYEAADKAFSLEYNGTDNRLYFNDLTQTTPLARVTFERAGDVGIGISDPTYRLHTADNTSTEVAMFDNQNEGTDSDGISIQAGAISNPGTDVDFIVFRDGDGDPIATIEGNGGGGVLYTTTSDARLKTKIQDYSNALNVLSRIGIKKYERISNPGIEEIGVIAQELQKVYPQAVSGSPDSDVKTDPMMVDYSKLTPLLVKGMQEQEQKISSQEVRIKELEERLAKLESLLDGKRFTTVNK